MAGPRALLGVRRLEAGSDLAIAVFPHGDVWSSVLRDLLGIGQHEFDDALDAEITGTLS